MSPITRNITENSPPAGKPMLMMRFQYPKFGFHWLLWKLTYFSSRKKYQPSSTTPITIAIELARPAPATPIAYPVPQPAINTGASNVFSNTVSAWIAIVGFTMPVPRSAAPMPTIANWRPSAGRYQ